MKINSVKTVVLRIPLPEPVGVIDYMIDSWWMTVAIVQTDQGVTGWGYNAGIDPSLKAVKTLIDEAITPHLLGRDVFMVRELWHKYYYKTHYMGESGVSFQGVAAVEIAMWDAIAKASGHPLWRLIGQAGPKRLPAYNTNVGWLSVSTNDMVERSKRAIGMGFTGVKIKVGSSDPAVDYARVRAVRAAIGDKVRLMIDANCKWDRHTAVRCTRRMEEFDLFWLEEPLHPFDISSHATLASELDTPILVGESITSLHMFRDFITARAVDILQPDVLKLGGISAWCEAASLAKIHGLPVVPAVWDMMQINAHLCATIPHVLMVEYIPWILHIFKTPIILEDGFLLTPEEPGIGTEITMEAMEKYAVA